MTVYETAIAALRGVGIEADALCRDGLAAEYAIVRLARKRPFYADDRVACCECTVEIRVFAKSGLCDLAQRAENALTAAGFGFVFRADKFDGEYQIATTEWKAGEE